MNPALPDLLEEMDLMDKRDSQDGQDLPEIREPQAPRDLKVKTTTADNIPSISFAIRNRKPVILNF